MTERDPSDVVVPVDFNRAPDRTPERPTSGAELIVIEDIRSRAVTAVLESVPDMRPAAAWNAIKDITQEPGLHLATANAVAAITDLVQKFPALKDAAARVIASLQVMDDTVPVAHIVRAIEGFNAAQMTVEEKVALMVKIYPALRQALQDYDLEADAHELEINPSFLGISDSD